MRYEIAHDTLARQILDRVSGEAKARRQAELLVARAYERYLQRRVLLTQEDLDEIRPHEKTINFSPEENRLIQESKKALERAARRKRQVLIGVITLLSVFLLFALWQWQRSVAGTRALRARNLYENGHTSQAFRMAQSAARTIGVDKNTTKTIEEVLSDISGTGLERDLIHDQAVQSFDVDAEEARLLSIVQGNSAWLWDLERRKKLLTVSHPDSLTGGAFISWPDSQVVFTTRAGHNAYYWDQGGNLVFKRALRDPIGGFDLSANLKLSLLWSENEVLLLSDSSNIWPTRMVPETILNADIAPGGEYLLIATPDSVQCWWLIPFTLGADLGPQFTIRGRIQYAEFVDSDEGNLKVLIQYSGGGNRIFNSNGQLDTISHYRFFNREIEKLPASDSIRQFIYSPPGQQKPKILFQTDSLSVNFWSANRYDVDQSPIGNIDFYTRYDEPVIATRFSQKGQYLLTASADGRVDIWDISGSSAKRAKRWRALIRQARFIDNDQKIITTAGDKTIKIWNLNAAKNRDMKSILDHYDKTLKINK